MIVSTGHRGQPANREGLYPIAASNCGITSIGCVGDNDYLLKGRGTPEEVYEEELQRCPPLCRYRWMLEELRVSFFAQSLGTAQPVSAKRLAQQWDAVEAWQRENPR